MRLVLDASVAIAAVRPNEPAFAASRALVTSVLAGHDQIAIPAIFPIEVAASLARVGEPAAAIEPYVDALVSVASEFTAIGARRAVQICRLAIASRLRAADATYVWLAAHLQIPICTLDREVFDRGAAFCRVVGP